MKKFLPVAILLMSFCFNALTQTTPVDTSWKKGGFIGLSFSQTNLSHWEQGGDNALSVSGKANLFCNYIKDKADWQNYLDLAYAVVQTGTGTPEKNDDKIELASKYGRHFSKNWLYSLFADFKSQFTNGYDYPNDSVEVSAFFAPAYVTIAPGLTYKPVPYFEIFLSPATAKWTFVKNDLLSSQGEFGVDSGETLHSEFGAYLNMYFKKDIFENVNLSSKIELFSNYSNMDKIDVNWQNDVNMKINSFLTATFFLQLIYDEDIIKQTQLKETLGVGFGVKF